LVERLKLDKVYPFRRPYHQCAQQRRRSVSHLTGSNIRAAPPSCPGIYPRSLRKDYWLWRIAGIDPADGRWAAAAWPRDLMRTSPRIDPGNPSDWPNVIALRKSAL